MNKINSHKNADKYKKGLLIPNSLLDICQDSFLAADKKREEANT